MRRPLVALLLGSLLGLLLALGLTAVTAPATAAGQITGRLVDSTNGAPVKGQTVRLRPIDDGGGPGTAIDTATTSDTGHFDLDSGSNPADEYYVQLVAGRYQGGYVGEEFVQPLRFAQTFGGGQDTGTVKALPAFIRGTVVNAKTLNPVGGVRVTARSQDEITEVDGADTTNSKGVFEITGLRCEDDCYLRLNGSAVGYESGYRACNAQVVPTWGAACASPIGRIGRIFLQRS